MKKLERRAILFLLLAAALVAGLCLFMYRYITQGDDWVTQPYNTHLYSNGTQVAGTIYDVNGEMLISGEGNKVSFAKGSTVRKATAHAVGDPAGNVATGAINAYKDDLAGYNLITGTYRVSGKQKALTLTIDKDICETAYEALDGRKGCVGVYNYKTGEIICMVSAPSFDPKHMPKDPKEGTYVNKFLSATMIPGSIFKLVTSAAAIENYSGLDDWSTDCTGSKKYGGQRITCTYAHGHVNFKSALAHSCNVGFAELANKVGAGTMEDYVDKLGLTTSYDINGIHNAKGSFEFPAMDKLSLGWAGIGQWKDQLNPASMLVYMSAIATDGRGTVPNILHDGEPGERTDQMIEESTAARLKKMMRNNVKKEYGEWNYPGLDIYAKTGTAEVGKGKEPNAWFTGFIDNEGYPYAFIVCVENGGTGSVVAGPVANSVMQKVIETDSAKTE